MAIDYQMGSKEVLNLNPENMQLLKEKIAHYLDHNEFKNDYNKRHNSYAFKHYFEEILGFYISNASFKEAMKELHVPCEPCPTSTAEFVYTIYPISQATVNLIMDDTANYKSPAALKKLRKREIREEYWLQYLMPKAD